MHPIIFEFPNPFSDKPFQIQAYGTVIVLAFLLAAWWTKRRTTKTLAVPEDNVFNIAFAVLFIGLGGARFVYALANYADFTKRPFSFLFIWEGGLVGYGGVVAALLFLAWWLPKKAEKGQYLEGKAWSLFDFLARGAALAFALGWIACLLAGDDYGKATTSPLGIPATWFEDRTPAKGYVADSKHGFDLLTTRLQPVQIYESVMALFLFGLLAIAAKKKLAPGRVAALFLMLHSIGHGLLDTLRGDSDKRGMVVGDFLSWSQFLAIPIFFAGLAIWMIRKPDRHPHAAPA